MKTKLIRGVLCAALTLPTLALAQEAAPEAAPAAPPAKAPAAESVKETWDYFYRGQGGGPVLVDAKLCTAVGKEKGPTQFECTAEINPADGVKANTPNLMLWQAYLVPQGDTVEDLMVQVKQGNTVRETKDVKVKGEGWRARQWTGLRLNKPGTWTVSIMRGDQVLKSIDVKVQ
jgi:hypothetical protein